MPHDDYLTRQLATMAPHRAILRAVECRLMGDIDVVSPSLDIGIGDGHFASIAYDEPIDVGIDIRSEELTEARDRCPVVYTAVLQASATTMPFADRSFSTVISNCAIEHIPDVDSVLVEIARVLRPGGTFATTLPSEHFGDFLLVSTVLRRLGANRLAASYGRFFNRISHHYHVDAPDVWRARLAAVGLDVVDQQYYFSPRAHRAFDVCHYLGLGHLVSRKLTGRWVPHPKMATPFDRWLRRYYEEPLPQPVGAYQYIRCVRRS